MIFNVNAINQLAGHFNVSPEISERDRQRIEATKGLKFFEWDVAQRWSEEAESERAREILHDAMVDLYRKEEYIGDCM